MTLDNGMIKNITVTFLFVASIFFLGCPQVRSTSSLQKPASIEDISKAVFSIHYQDAPHGMGMLVGINDLNKERVFLLTARHVATYNTLSNSKLTLDFVSSGKISIQGKSDRWYTAAKNIDVAWVELSEEEKSEFRKRNLLNFILFGQAPCASTAMIKGSWALGMLQFAKENPDANVLVKMFYQQDVIDGDLSMKNIGVAPLPFRYNRNMKMCNILVALARTSQLCKPKDSGGPVFMQYQTGDRKFWLLCGLIVGGNREMNVNAIQPIDEVIREIRFSSRRLIDFPEYW